jgi:hypothetical protein
VNENTLPSTFNRGDGSVFFIRTVKTFSGRHMREVISCSGANMRYQRKLINGVTPAKGLSTRAVRH